MKIIEGNKGFGEETIRKGREVPKRDRYIPEAGIKDDDVVGRPMFEQSAEMKQAIADAEHAHDVRELVNEQSGGMSGIVVRKKPESKKVIELRDKQRDLRLLQEDRDKLGFFASKKRKRELDSAITQKQQEVDLIKNKHVAKGRESAFSKKEAERISKRIYSLEQRSQKLRFYQIGEKRKIQAELSHLQNRLSGLRKDFVKERIAEELR